MVMLIGAVGFDTTANEDPQGIGSVKEGCGHPGQAARDEDTENSTHTRGMICNSRQSVGRVHEFARR